MYEPGALLPSCCALGPLSSALSPTAPSQPTCTQLGGSQESQPARVGVRPQLLSIFMFPPGKGKRFSYIGTDPSHEWHLLSLPWGEVRPLWAHPAGKPNSYFRFPWPHAP